MEIHAIIVLVVGEFKESHFFLTEIAAKNKFVSLLTGKFAHFFEDCTEENIEVMWNEGVADTGTVTIIVTNGTLNEVK